MAVNSFSGLPAIPASYGFTAGKNKIINGDFAINQRTFSSTTTSNTYGFDRFAFLCADGTVTYSAQTFTPGTAPVAGYEAANFARIVTTGQTLSSAEARLVQRIENVRTFANQTITISFWAKANSGTPNVAVECIQSFGTGGSPSSNVTAIIASPAKQAISTSWARYSFTIAVPSISGKTIGTDANSSALIISLWVSAGSNFDARTGTLGIQTNTFDFWGVQVEAGSVATAFQTATGTLAGELAACQRYYERWAASGNGDPILMAQAISTSAVLGGPFYMKVRKRTTTPTITYSSASHFGFTNASNSSANTGTLDSSVVNADTFRLYASGIASSPLVAGNACFVNANTSSAYIEMSSEL